MKLLRHIARRSSLILAFAASLACLQALAVEPGLESFKKGNLYGFEDTQGNTVIPAQFNNVMEFSHGLAAVCIQGKWGYIDPQGTFVIQPQFDNAGYFSEDLAKVRVNGKYGFIDRSGKFVIEPQFDDASQFSRGTAWVAIGDEECFIDRNGKMYADRADAAQGVSQISSPETVRSIPVSNNVPVQEIRESPTVREEPRLQENSAERTVAPVQNQFETVAHNEDSKKAQEKPAGQDIQSVKPLDENMTTPDNYTPVEKKEPVDYTKLSDKSISPFNEDGKYGYKTTAGQIVIAPQFDNALPFSEGLAPVFLSGKWGYVDMNGDIVVPIQYDEVGFFFNGAASVKKNGEVSFVDRNGNSHMTREAAIDASAQ